jgi:hypothetical protein
VCFEVTRITHACKKLERAREKFVACEQNTKTKEKNREKEKKLRRCSARCEDESIADDGTKKTALESESVFIRHRWHAL